MCNLFAKFKYATLQTGCIKKLATLQHKIKQIKNRKDHEQDF